MDFRKITQYITKGENKMSKKIYIIFGEKRKCGKIYYYSAGSKVKDKQIYFD